MAGEPESVVLNGVRRLEEKLDRLGEDIRVLAARLNLVDERISGLERQVKGTNLRLDRVETRLADASSDPAELPG